MIYTIIAYKPDSVDSVMSCVQSRYSSDFDYFVTSDADQAAAWYVQKELDESLERYEADWQLTALYNGEEYPKDDSVYEEFESLIKNATYLIKTERIEKKEEEKRLAEEKAAFARKESMEKDAAAERALFESLKAKYEK